MSPLVVNGADPTKVLRALEIVGVSYFNLPSARGGYLSSGNTGAPPPTVAAPGEYRVTPVAGTSTMTQPLTVTRSATATRAGSSP